MTNLLGWCELCQCSRAEDHVCSPKASPMSKWPCCDVCGCIYNPISAHVCVLAEFEIDTTVEQGMLDVTRVLTDAGMLKTPADGILMGEVLIKLGAELKRIAKG